MLSGKDVAAIGLGGALGAGQTIGFREFDNMLASSYMKNKSAGQSVNPPFLMKQLGNFGSTSVIGNGFLSAVELGVGIYSGMNRKGHGLKNTQAEEVLVAAGAGGLVGTFASMAFPPVQWSNAVAVDPSRPYRGPGSTGVSIVGQTRSSALGSAVVS